MGSSSRSPGSWRRPSDGRAAARERAHLRQPPPPPQLPALLRRPGGLGQRHLHAEHRDRVARARAHPLAGRGRAAGRVPVPAVHAVRPVRRRDRRRLDARQTVIGTQAVSMVFAGVLAGLTLGGVVTAWEVLLLAGLRGTVLVLDAPARQALTFEMVGRDELPNAVALNSSLFNAARVVGPAIGRLV